MQGLGFGLTEKVIDAVSRWTFKPGHKNGELIIHSAEIEVNFRLLD
jgi:hypothetical protein